MRASLPFAFFACVVALLAMLAALSTALAAIASDPPRGNAPAWDQLSAAQREQLIAPVRERWNTEPAERARMLEHAQRWKQMTPEQRQHARHGMKRWEHMSPEQRAQMRALFEQMRGMTPSSAMPQAAVGGDDAGAAPAWVQAHPAKPHHCRRQRELTADAGRLPSYVMPAVEAKPDRPAGWSHRRIAWPPACAPWRLTAGAAALA